MTIRFRPVRPDIDKSARRYFVYSLLNSDGSPVYIGRSCNVAARLRAHHSDATHRQDATAWVFDVRSVSMVGPFTWDEAVREERRQIEIAQPRGNISLTSRDHRPHVAAASAARAEAKPVPDVVVAGQTARSARSRRAS